MTERNTPARLRSEHKSGSGRRHRRTRREHAQLGLTGPSQFRLFDRARAENENVDQVNASFAISSTRARLRCGSARGFPRRCFGRFEGKQETACDRRQSPPILFCGDYLRLLMEVAARQ
jgi:hypothetical protein